MIYDKRSIDYQVNVFSLHEMEEVVPMTLRERSCLRRWVRSGHELESNPWGLLDSDGMPLNYMAIPAVRGTTGKVRSASLYGVMNANAFSVKTNCNY